MLTRLNRLGLGVCLLFVMVASSSLTDAVQQVDAAGPRQRFVVVVRSDLDYDKLRSAAQQAGATIDKDMRDGGMLVVSGPAALKGRIQSTGLTDGVANDHVESIIRPSARADSVGQATHARKAVDAATSEAVASALGRRQVRGDPAFRLPGLMWSIDRVDAPAAWQTTTGSPTVRVGVADTGLDFTHAELAQKIADVVDFTGQENPPICQTFFSNPIDPTQGGIGDADLATMFGGPATTDWNGHGSWIGGNIAAAMDDRGLNGIAPGVKLVSLKVSGWCGAAYDSEILDAFLYAGRNHIDVVNTSFGGSYLDASNPDDALLLRQYQRVVRRVRNMGTVVVGSAGNEHLQVALDGRVTSHGTLTTPGTSTADFSDLFGQFEVPAGVAGVIDVSSTGNVVVPSSAKCADAADGSSSNPDAVCKPRADQHQARGQGLENQLTYYSNYGPRIDVAAPGGARKFNLPSWDRGGTLGFPYTTDDATTAYGDFSTTSNWAVQTQCFTFSAGGFPPNQCYSTLQGTSMSTPHVVGVLALIASADRSARGNPDRLEQILRASARKVVGNRTQVLSATDTSPGDLSGVACTTGYCHLGGEAVTDREAYGAGIVDAREAVDR
jgi:subtilisin family serine protease